MRDRTPEECARVTAAAVADGFGAVRIAPFDFLRERSDRAVYGVELAMAVREAIGPDVDFMIDCHTHLRYAEMLAIAPDLAALRWLEDPFDPARIDDWRRIKDMVGVPMAGGEHTATEAELRPALEAGVLDGAARRQARRQGASGSRPGELVASYNVEVAMHNPSGPVASAASLHAQAGALHRPDAGVRLRRDRPPPGRARPARACRARSAPPGRRRGPRLPRRPGLAPDRRVTIRPTRVC